MDKNEILIELFRLIGEELANIELTINKNSHNEEVLQLKLVREGMQCEAVLAPDDPIANQLRKKFSKQSHQSQTAEILKDIQTLIQMQTHTNQLKEEIAKAAKKQIVSYLLICPVCQDYVADIQIIFRANTLQELEQCYLELPSDFPNSSFPKYCVSMHPQYLLHCEDWLREIDTEETGKMHQDKAAAIILPSQPKARFIALSELKAQWNNLRLGHCAKIH